MFGLLRRGGRGFTLIEIMIVLAIIAILTVILLPNFVRARSQSRLTACTSNLKNLATACESYGVDNQTRYPTLLTQLTPTHIQSIPSCPSLGAGTSYRNGFSSVSNPDAFTIVCAGDFHGELGLSVNYPQYQSATGLVEK